MEKFFEFSCSAFMYVGEVYGVHILDVCEGWRRAFGVHIWISLLVTHTKKGFLTLVRVKTWKTCGICQSPWTTKCFELELIMTVPNFGGKFNVVCWFVANVLSKDQ